MADDTGQSTVIELRERCLELAVRNYGTGGFFSTEDVVERAKAFERYVRGDAPGLPARESGGEDD